MATFSFELGVKHNFGNALRYFEETPSRIDRAVFEATQETTDFMAQSARSQMERIAGGVYWDINTETNSTPTGARGSVRTPPSRPHRITGNPYLHFYWPAQNRWVKTREVNHPGSSPVDWIDPSRTPMTAAAERIFSQKVGSAISGSSSRVVF